MSEARVKGEDKAKDGKEVSNMLHLTIVFIVLGPATDEHRLLSAVQVWVECVGRTHVHAHSSQQDA